MQPDNLSVRDLPGNLTRLPEKLWRANLAPLARGTSMRAFAARGTSFPSLAGDPGNLADAQGT